MAKLELEQYTDKRILVTVNTEEGASEVEGVAQAANELGLLIKPKGKMGLDLIPIADIIEVKYVAEKQKPLVAKVLKPVGFGQARTHLLERHALLLEEVNGMSEQEAFDKHNEIDHVEADLGHVHGDKNKTERAEAVEAGEED